MSRHAKNILWVTLTCGIAGLLTLAALLSGRETEKLPSTARFSEDRLFNIKIEVLTLGDSAEAKAIREAKDRFCFVPKHGEVRLASTHGDFVKIRYGGNSGADIKRKFGSPECPAGSVLIYPRAWYKITALEYERKMHEEDQRREAYEHFLDH